MHNHPADCDDPKCDFTLIIVATRFLFLFCYWKILELIF